MQNSSSSVAIVALDAFASSVFSLESSNQLRVASAVQVAAAVEEVAAAVRENCVLRTATLLRAPAAVLGTYVHNAVTPGAGTLAAAVAIEGATLNAAEPPEQVAALARALAMQVAGTPPLCVAREDMPAARLACPRERHIALSLIHI